eukprot:378571-Pelagomonas_calceolata.AAC.1
MSAHAGGADLYADLVAGLPSPQDIISAVQHKVGSSNMIEGKFNDLKRAWQKTRHHLIACLSLSPFISDRRRLDPHVQRSMQRSEHLKHGGHFEALVGAVEGLPWGVIAQSLGEVASAFSAASAAAAARAQGSASERAQGSAAKHANAVLSKKGDSGKQGASAAAAVKEADSAAGVGKERPGNKSATFTVGGQESKSLEEEKEEQAGRDK